MSSTYYISKLLATLASSWLTLGWKARKTKKAFEAELTKEGMSSEDARRISRYISDLKDQFSLRSMLRYYKEAKKQGENLETRL